MHKHYRYNELRTVEYSTIHDHFNDTISIYDQHVRLLAEHINKHYYRQLFCGISLNRLIVGNTDPLTWAKELLLLSPSNNAESICFEYVSTPFKKPEFSRVYEASDIVEKFDQFVHWVNW